jgi:8-amino-7-oxononanoate synthase
VKQSPPALRYLDAALEDLDAKGLLRRRADPCAGAMPSFCSNDYLGLAERVIPAAEAQGAGASRLVSGERAIHGELERAVARWLGADAALLFTSGYAANVGLLSALAAADDLIVSDALNHASIIDGARLSRARVVVVPHLDIAAIAGALTAPRTGRAWVVTESYFSMDADGPDLSALREVCDAHGAALVVDEAHALGVLGPEGRGRCVEAGVRPDVLVGTFGKAFGASGAFVAGCETLTAWLWNRARSFVFSTGVSPVLAGAALRGFVASIEQPELRATTLARAEQLRRGLSALGIAPAGFGHIIPWVVGAPDRAMRVASQLRERGIPIAAIRPPSVPDGTARLRFTATARQTASDVDAVVRAVEAVLACEPR